VADAFIVVLIAEFGQLETTLDLHQQVDGFSLLVVVDEFRNDLVYQFKDIVRA